MSVLSTVGNWFGQAASWLGITGQRVSATMLTAMTGNNPKPEWPPLADRPRLIAYHNGRMLYRGEHAAHLDKRDSAQKTAHPYVAVNLCGALTDLVTGRLFGQPFTATVPEELAGTQDFIYELMEHNYLENACLVAAAGASYRGDACFKVRYDEGQRRVVVETFSPSCFFPEMHPLDATRMVAANLDQVLLRKADDPYLWRERHEPGVVRNQLFRLDKDQQTGVYHFDPATDEVDLNTIEALADLPPEMGTGVDALLVVHVANRPPVEGQFFGQSDYDEALVSLQAEANSRETQRAAVLSKHVDPTMTGPMVPDAFKDGAGNVKLEGMKYLEVGPGQQEPKYVVWDPQLPAVENQLKDLKVAFAVNAGVEMTALVPQEGGAGPVSGRALRLSQMKTQTTVALKQRAWGPGLQRLLSVATKLAAAVGPGALDWKPAEGSLVAVGPEDITVTFSDGLPQDRMEDVEEQTAMVAAGLQTPKRAMMALHGVSSEEADAMLEEMGAAKQAMAPPAPGGSSLFRAIVPQEAE